MLTRSTQVGEFYVMMPPQINPGDDPGDRTHTCDLLIYDEESDKHVRISWLEALKACCINPAGAADGMIDGTAIQLEGGSLANWYNGAMRWAAYNAGMAFSVPAGGGPAVENWVGINADGVLVSADANGGAGGFATVQMPQSYANMNTDVRIVLARPFIEHLMHSAILTVSGRDTGATLFGPADMCAQSPSRLRGLCPSRPFFAAARRQLSANTQVKTIEGHCESCTRRVDRSWARRSPNMPWLVQTRATSRP